MGLLLDAARSWERLHDVSYIIEVGHREKFERIELTFLNGDFTHLAGIHYAKDVDFGLRRAEYYGERLIPAVLGGRLNDENIEKAREWQRTIRGRLITITNLESILDNPFKIVSFDKRKVRGYCSIDARFAIKSEISDEICFVFLDRDTGRYYCKSAFCDRTKDYTENQSVMTVLQKIKVIDGDPKILYIKSGYISDVKDPVVL